MVWLCYDLTEIFVECSISKAKLLCEDISSALWAHNFAANCGKEEKECLWIRVTDKETV